MVTMALWSFIAKATVWGFDAHEWSEIGRNVATIGAGVAAVIWFMRTRSYKRRTAFDLSCRVFHLDDRPNASLAEITIEIENPGPLRETIQELTFCVEKPCLVASTESQHEAVVATWQEFAKTSSIRMKDDQKLVIMPGVHQVITHSVVLPEGVSTIRVTVAFRFRPGKSKLPSGGDLKYPYKRTARRVFDVRRVTAKSAA